MMSNGLVHVIARINVYPDLYLYSSSFGKDVLKSQQSGRCFADDILHALPWKNILFHVIIRTNYDNELRCHMASLRRNAWKKMADEIRKFCTQSTDSISVASSKTWVQEHSYVTGYHMQDTSFRDRLFSTCNSIAPPSLVPCMYWFLFQHYRNREN